jgi:propanol-preferring alcohol dehydrogenase
VNSKKEDPVKAVMELKLGADAVIEFVNASKTVETVVQFLRRRARLVLVGLWRRIKVKFRYYAHKRI